MVLLDKVQKWVENFTAQKVTIKDDCDLIVCIEPWIQSKIILILSTYRHAVVHSIYYDRFCNLRKLGFQLSNLLWDVIVIHALQKVVILERTECHQLKNYSKRSCSSNIIERTSSTGGSPVEFVIFIFSAVSFLLYILYRFAPFIAMKYRACCFFIKIIS